MRCVTKMRIQRSRWALLAIGGSVNAPIPEKRKERARRKRKRRVYNDQRARQERGGGGSAAPAMHLSVHPSARVTESDEISGRGGTRVYDFRMDQRGSVSGCCARVRINLRLLVKIRALSFHAGVRARARARSLVRPRPTCAPTNRCAGGTFT